MFRLLTNWIRKRLGHHVCEEFTRWQRKQDEWEVIPVIEGIPMHSMTCKRTAIWQERQCTICGKIEQQSLEQ